MTYAHFIFQVNTYLILFYLFYLLLLRNETFFKLNRIYLLSSGLLSLTIPVLQSSWIRSLLITEKVREITYGISLAPYSVNISNTGQKALQLQDIVLIVYVCGLLFFSLRFIYRLLKIFKPEFKDRRAYSFFNRVIVPDTLPGKETILKHEYVHVKQLHSTDVILFELIAILNWFNPVVYLYKKDVSYTHEFIADELAAESSELGKPEYALLLLSNAFGIEPEQLTNSFFNESLLKRRILMLHKTRSHRTAVLKYGLSLPLFLAMLIFSSSSINAEELKTLIAEMPTPASQTSSTPVKESDYTSKKTRNNNRVTSTEQSVSGLEKTELPANITIPPADTTKNNETSNSIMDFSKIDVTPEFPGGMRAFSEYVGKNYQYPEEAKKQGVNGKLIASFIVEKDGSLSNIKILHDLKLGTGEEAIRLLSTSPKWKPGEKSGQPVRVQYTLPIMLKSRNAPENNLTKEFLSGKLLIINNKEVSADDFIKVVEKDMNNRFPGTSLKVLKGDAAITAYGEKGKNGVLIFETAEPK